MAEINGLDAEGAAAIIAARTQTPFSSISDFRTRLQRPQLNIDETQLSVRSDWFLVTIDARQGDTRARARALIRRSSTTTDWPFVVWQTVE
jgi:type II secretory pathway component PulK